MRIVQTVPSRPMYYDRSPVNVSFRYDAANIGPHSLTLRASYTVPNGKNAMLEVVSLNWRRQTLATAPDTVWLLVSYTPSGGSAMYIYSRRFISNTVATPLNETITSLGLMRSGDKVEFYTQDDSTGGLCAYHFDAKIFEFLT